MRILILHEHKTGPQRDRVISLRAPKYLVAKMGLKTDPSDSTLTL